MRKRLICIFWLLIAPLTLHAESVRLVTSEWPPYVGTELKGMGHVFVIVTTAFQNAGYDPVVEFLPWHEAIQLSKHRNEAIFPEYEKLNTGAFACSDPISAGPIGLYKRKHDVIHFTVKDPKRNQEDALQGLKQYRFGVVKGYTNTRAFDEADYLQKVEAVSDLANLNQLKDGKVDLIISDVFVAEHFMDKLHPQFSTIEFMGPALENKTFYLCFDTSAPHYKRKLAAFNQALKALQAHGKTEEIMSSYGF